MARSLLMNISPGHITTFTYQGNDSCFTMYVDFNSNIGIKANYINNGNNTTTVSVYATALEKRPTRIQFEGVSDFNSRLINIHYINFTTLTSLYKIFYGAQYLTSLNTAYITIKNTIDISYTNLDAFSIQSIVNSLYNYSGSNIAASERTIYVGSLSISNSQKTQISDKNWVLKTTSSTILLNSISDITVVRGNTFDIIYSTNISAVKHEISWDNGSTFWEKTSEIASNGTTYTYAHAADTEYDHFDMAIRVTDANGNVSTRCFTITFTDSGGGFTFTQYKRLDDGVVNDTTDGTYYTTVNKISVTSGAKYRIDINPVSYVCICFYDSNGNFVDWMENNTSDWSVGSLSTTFTVGSNVKYLRVCGVSDGTRVTGALNKIS